MCFEQLIYASCVTHTVFESMPLQPAQPALPAYGAGYCSRCIHNFRDCLRYCCNPVAPETVAKLQKVRVVILSSAATRVSTGVRSRRARCSLLGTLGSRNNATAVESKHETET